MPQFSVYVLFGSAGALDARFAFLFRAPVVFHFSQDLMQGMVLKFQVCDASSVQFSSYTDTQMIAFRDDLF
jgi:hypothetical protein